MRKRIPTAAVAPLAEDCFLGSCRQSCSKVTWLRRSL